MARPTKQGVDYFPLDVHLDDKFKFVQIKYGLTGFAIAIKLLQKIYSYGYWYSWSEDEMLLFCDDISGDKEIVCGVVDECLERDLFNKKIYDQHQVLTSHGIQKRYFEITKRRKDIKYEPEYLLVDINAYINDVNVCNNQESCGVNAYNNSQSKVNKRKVNKTRIDTTTTTISSEDEEQHESTGFPIIETYEASFGRIELPEQMILNNLAKQYGKAAVMKAVQKTVLRTPPPENPIAYMSTILENSAEFERETK